MEEITIQTHKNKEVIDITSRVEKFVKEQGKKNGVVHVHVLHTTTALSTADLDPGTDLDMLDAFYEIMPALEYRHPHDPEHTPDHILSAMIGADVSIPVKEARLLLGTWQRIVLFEFDGPQERSLVLSFVTI